ncbi:hypothetical protein ACHQM5_002549 [Ranunculus cassubicifolius]
MERSENILETIYEEETLEDVDMIDAESYEEGEIPDDKQGLQSADKDNTSCQATHTKYLKPKPKRKKNKKKKKARPVSTITDINRFVLDTCRRLKEKKPYLIWNAVGCLGVAALTDLIKEVDAIQACGGQMTADGKRPRNGGGVLWNILKTREPTAYKEIMTKGKEFEAQFRKPNSQQGEKTVNAQQGDETEEEQASDARQGERISALNRIRVPVSYDDLLGDDIQVKNDGS